MQRIVSLLPTPRTLPSALLSTLITLLFPALLTPPPACAAVCYSAQARGYTLSRYQLDTLTSPWLAALIDFTSDPWEVAGSEVLDYSRPEVFAAFERRYGPRTACLGGLTSLPECDGHAFKRFAGPGNEVRSFVADALAWWAVSHPEGLGGDPGCRGDGRPSEREITDVQAVADHAVWERFHAEALPGGSAANPLSICRAGRSAGAFTEVDSFWGWTNYLWNTCGPAPTPTPAAPDPPATQPARACARPPQAVLDAARRVRNRSSAKAAGQLVIDWLNAARSCAGG